MIRSPSSFALNCKAYTARHQRRCVVLEVNGLLEQMLDQKTVIFFSPGRLFAPLCPYWFRLGWLRFLAALLADLHSDILLDKKIFPNKQFKQPS
jgi:hypothetical protein